MDSMDVNKALAAVLVSGIAFFVAGLAGEVLVPVRVPKQSAIKIDPPVSAAPVAKASGGGTPAEPPIAALLVSADVGAGEGQAKKVCGLCHSFNEGGKAGVGPNLYGVVGGPHGHMEGYSYSAAIKAKAGPWTYDELNAWLLKPSAYAPGTKMGFAGLSNPKERANVIAYLHTLAHDPVPYPPPPPSAPAQAASLSAAPPSGPAPAGAPAGGDTVEVLMASADPKAGQSATAKLGCVACHSFNQGGKAGIGPNLYGVVGAPHGHMEGYSYSAALKGKEGPWTVAELDKWLLKPAAYAPGTKMSFAGIPDAKNRANVISYLASLSPTPTAGTESAGTANSETANPETANPGAANAGSGNGAATGATSTGTPNGGSAGAAPGVSSTGSDPHAAPPVVPPTQGSSQGG